MFGLNEDLSRALPASRRLLEIGQGFYRGNPNKLFLDTSVLGAEDNTAIVMQKPNLIRAQDLILIHTKYTRCIDSYFILNIFNQTYLLNLDS